MTDFIGNASKENLRQRVSTALQRIELLKKKPRTRLANPNRLRFPRRSHAGGVVAALYETLLVTLIGIALLSGVCGLIIFVLKRIQ